MNMVGWSIWGHVCVRWMWLASLYDAVCEMNVVGWSLCAFIRQWHAEAPVNLSALQVPWKAYEVRRSGAVSGWGQKSTVMTRTPEIRSGYWGLLESRSGWLQQCLEEPSLGPGVTVQFHRVALKDGRGPGSRMIRGDSRSWGLASTDFGPLSTKTTQQKSEEEEDNPHGIQRKRLLLTSPQGH